MQLRSMLVVGYCYGIRSERRLCEEAQMYCQSLGLDQFQRDENDIACRKVGQDSNGQSNKR